MRVLTQVSIINSLIYTHTDTGWTPARQSHLSSFNPPVPYFSLRLCTELTSI
ncbi:unnamed protein product [Hymenolepis diminuta]|uniref:Uncharacterized protein n=1 Tax=Hymenolepis diminuta TaxID=6216 RepID=A0A564XX21_HYMDI|nr:unnamed protein product [Hymenolepis diminuta]